MRVLDPWFWVTRCLIVMSGLLTAYLVIEFVKLLMML